MPLYETHSSGTVRDFHPIPFSSAPRTRHAEQNAAKIGILLKLHNVCGMIFLIAVGAYAKKVSFIVIKQKKGRQIG